MKQQNKYYCGKSKKVDKNALMPDLTLGYLIKLYMGFLMEMMQMRHWLTMVIVSGVSRQESLFLYGLRHKVQSKGCRNFQNKC